MANSMLPSSLRLQCRTVGKLKCTEQLQPGNTKRPNIQLDQKEQSDTCVMSDVFPINQSMATTKKNYVFKRRSIRLATNNDFHANQSTIGEMQQVNNCEQLSSHQLVNVGSKAALGSNFAIAHPNGFVVVNFGSDSSIPKIMSPLNQPLTHNDHTPTNNILPDDSIISYDVIASQESKDLNSENFGLKHQSISRNSVISDFTCNNLNQSNQCSNNPSINEVDHTSYGPLINTGRPSYTFKKLSEISPNQTSMLQHNAFQTNNIHPCKSELLKNGTLPNSNSASSVHMSNSSNITGVQHNSLQVSSPCSSITGCYVALASPAISNSAPKTIIGLSPVHLQQLNTREYSTTAGSTPLLLNLLSVEGGVGNRIVEASVQRSSECKNIPADSNRSELVTMSGEEIVPVSDVCEPAVSQEVPLPKVPKKAAASRKRQNKSSKGSNKATVSSNAENTAGGATGISADLCEIAVSHSEAEKEDTVPTTTKKGATKKRAPKNASAKASSSTKDPKTSDASKKKTSAAIKASDFSSESPEVEMDPLLVYFDLETTGLGYTHEIVQISCVCPDVADGGEFDVYTLPMGHFQPMASMITGLTRRGQSICLHGKPVPTVSLQEGLTRLQQWLETLPRPPLLVGHNSRRFDCPRLALALWNNNSLDLLNKTICGFSDSLPTLRTLLPSRGDHKLENLLRQYCPNSTESSHNALDDCRALHSVLWEVIKCSTKPDNTTTVSAANKSSQTAGVSSPVAAAADTNLSGGEEVKLFESMVSDFEQDLIREALNESLLKEYFSLQTVLDSMRRSGPAKAAMRAGGS